MWVARFAQREGGQFQNEEAIMALLASQPTPEEVLGIRPSPELQARVSELLAKNKTTALTSSETAELERYLTLEHLVRLAKAHAYKLCSGRPQNYTSHR